MLAIVLAPVAVALRAVQRVSWSMHTPRAHVTPAMRAEAERALGPIEDVALRTSDGLTLHGWYAPSKRRAAVILVHGGGGNRTSMLPEATALVARGFGVLVYDTRFCGESDGELGTWGDAEQADVVAALDFVAHRVDVDPARIGLEGFSIGATTASLVTARDPRVHAVLLHAVWTSFEDEVAYKFGHYGPFSLVPAMWAFQRGGVHPEAVRPIDHIAEIAPRPLLFITGGRDIDTPLPVVRQLLAVAGDPKDMWVVEGAAHGRYVESAPDEYPRRVVAFFEGALGPR